MNMNDLREGRAFCGDDWNDTNFNVKNRRHKLDGIAKLMCYGAIFKDVNQINDCLPEMICVLTGLSIYLDNIETCIFQADTYKSLLCEFGFSKGFCCVQLPFPIHSPMIPITNRMVKMSKKNAIGINA